MDALIKLAVMALARTGAADMAESARRTAATTLLAIVSGVLATASLGCAIAALWIFADSRIGPSGAALATAGCLLVLCLAVLGLLQLVLRRHRRPPAVGSPELLLAEATRLFKDHKGTLLVAALVAGLLAGNESRER